ncbi:MAG TPA: PAS domain S-box protein [Thermoanaerobaculia bacterium]|nr:PAS domain S-box protein [Thermoanaerobaculia bacterium]
MSALRVALVGCTTGEKSAVQKTIPDLLESAASEADIVIAGSEIVPDAAAFADLRSAIGAKPIVIVGEGAAAEVPSLKLEEIRLLPDVIRRELRLAGLERSLRAAESAYREAMERSEQREKQLALAMQIARIASWEYDVERRVFRGSSEVARLFETRRRGELPFDEAFRRCHPDDVERVRAAFSRALETKSDLECEYRIVLRDRILYVHSRASFRSEEGGPARMIGVIQDVSDRHAAEEALRRSEALYRAVVEQASEVIFTIDAKGRFTSLNSAFEKLTGWIAGEWLGRHLSEWIDSESLALAEEHSRQVMQGKTVCADYRVRTKRGDAVTVEMSMQRLVSDGSAGGAIGLARDVTRRREQEAQAEKERRLASLGHLAASVAHEFNNVLMSILPFAELLKRRAPGDEAVEAATQHIFKAIRRGKQVSQEILRFARTNAVEVTSIDLREWLGGFEREAAALLGPRYTIRSEIGIDGEQVWVRADRGLLEQVVTNLLLNARDAMPEGGFVTFEVRRSASEPREIEFSIRDSGSGIAESVIDRIFDPLFTTKPGAAGLGLSVALQAMVQQEGTIRVASSVGVGTTFTLVLREGSAEVPPAAASEQASDRQSRILLVEDDEAVGEGIRALLADEGFDVRLVTRGGEAQDAVREFQPEVTILDVNLGDMNGVDVFERLRAEWPDIRVIFSTGHADSGALENVRQREVPTIMKPYEIDDLVTIIRRLLRGAPVA